MRGGFGCASTLTLADAAALTNRDSAPDIQAVAAETTSNASLTAGTTNWTTTLTGTSPSWQEVRSRTVSAGRFLTAADDAGTAAVVVLGPDTATELFPSVDPVGQTRHRATTSR